MDSVPSRELAGDLDRLATLLTAQASVLGIDRDSQTAVVLGVEVQRLGELARWLYNAKFEVRDPEYLLIAVRELLKQWDQHRDGISPGIAFELDTPFAKVRDAFKPFKGS